MGILDKAANVGIILVCGAVVADIAVRNMRPQSAAASAPSAANGPQLPNEYKPGEALGSLPGFAPKSDAKSLLFVVKSTCRFCTDSMPFYQRVVQEVRAAKTPVRLVGVCLESSEACTEYLKRHNLAMDLTLAVPQGTLKVVGTPTLILVDEAGKVGKVWTGMLPAPEQQQAVLDTVLKGKSGNS
jgi:peroxiredoxin